MNYDKPRLRAWLVEEGANFFDKVERPLAVGLRENHTTMTADISFPDGSTQLTLKAAPHNDRHEIGPKLCHIHDRVTQESELLSRSTPLFYGYHEGTRCVAMEFVPGATMLDLLKAELSGRRPEGYDCDQLLGESAEVFAEFHRLTPSCAGLATPTRSNGSFVVGLEHLLREPAMKKLVGPVEPAVRRAIDALPDGFTARIGDRLLIPDAQPKNILVPAPDRVCFIDLDFNSGPPAMNLALFVSAFDRLQTRYFSPRAAATIGRWKQKFLDSYFRHTDVAETVDEFPFFYLWALVYTMRRHMRDSRWWSLYLSRRYVHQIQSILEKGAFDRRVADATV